MIYKSVDRLWRGSIKVSPNAEASQKCADLTSPRITLCGELDEVVDNRAIRDRMERWPNSTFAMIQNANHDVLTEIPDFGGEVMEQIVELFSSSKAVGSA